MKTIEQILFTAFTVMCILIIVPGMILSCAEVSEEVTINEFEGFWYVADCNCELESLSFYKSDRRIKSNIDLPSPRDIVVFEWPSNLGGMDEFYYRTESSSLIVFVERFDEVIDLAYYKYELSSNELRLTGKFISSDTVNTIVLFKTF